MNELMFHQPYEPFAYALSKTTAHVVLYCDAKKVNGVVVHYGDRYAQSLDSQTSMRYVGWNGEHAVFVASVDIPTSRLKYRFEATLSDGVKRAFYGERGIARDAESAGAFQLAYLCPRDVFTVPDWVDQAVCYQIFPERFENGSPALTPDGAVAWEAPPTPRSMHGGDLPGIVNRLDYLHDLGVNLLYLTPIFKASSNHKYDTYDYKQIDPQFGTLDDLKWLVKAAHSRGIRVVLDAVFNHSGIGFAPFQDVLKKGRKSPYHDWFFIDGNKPNLRKVNYETFATRLMYMPKLNVANAAVEAFLLDVATYWIRECDIDGWRLDVANEIDHVFWRKFRHAVKSIKPDALIVGEVWHNALPWLRGDQFDSVMNYRFTEACVNFFAKRTLNPRTFRATLVALLYQAPEPATRSMFNLLGSHDTERILNAAKGDVNAVLLAMTCLFAYPGIPMVYYGDEIGMAGGPDPDCRRGMVWDRDRQNVQIHRAVSQLAHLRQSHPALQSARLEGVGGEGSLIEFRRLSQDGTTAIKVLLNNGRVKVPVSVAGDVLFATRPDALVDGWLKSSSAIVVQE